MTATVQDRRTENHAPDQAGGWSVLARRLGRRFGLDQHRQMERFIATTAVFAVTLALIAVAAVTTVTIGRVNQLSNQALYTMSWTSSRSKVSGTVLGLQRSADGSRAVVWTRVPSVKSLSTDAGLYDVFVTGGTTDGGVTPTRQTLRGQYLVYGTTGVMAIVLDAVDGQGRAVPLRSELLAITVRANREIAPASSTTPREEGDSFDKFDQWRLFENPGASDAVLDAALGTAATTFDAAAFHRRHVAAPELAGRRAQAQEQLATLRVDLARIQEYTQRVEEARYGELQFVEVRTPAIVAGDQVLGEPGSLQLQTTTTVAGGHNFAVRADDSLDGYAGMPLSTAPVAPPGQWRAETTWRLSDGRLLADLGEDRTATALRTAVADLESAWSAYYDHKRAHQRDLLGDVVELAQAQDTIDKTISTNTDAVEVY